MRVLLIMYVHLQAQQRQRQNTAEQSDENS